MNSLEKKAIRTFNQMWEEWCTPNIDGLHKALVFYSDQFHGYGSASHELWKGPSDMQRFYERSGIENPGGFAVAFITSRYDHG